MVVRMYAIFDEKGQMYSSPFCLAHDSQAIRAFGDTACDATSRINKHPDDYRLYWLGTFDDCSGRVEGLSVPEFLVKASEFTTVRKTEVKV